jgi:signal transduction histidine kinase
MSYLLHPPLLDENGLTEAIRWYIQGFSERSGINIEFSICECFGRLPDEMELAIFRIVQECLTNIHRHSGSKKGMIRISRDAENVSLEISDDGKGITAEKLGSIKSQRSGVGLAGIHERVHRYHRSPHAVRSALGRLVRHGHPRVADASRQRVRARPRAPAGPRRGEHPESDIAHPWSHISFLPRSRHLT